jgi:hypothetical protein
MDSRPKTRPRPHGSLDPIRSRCILRRKQHHDALARCRHYAVDLAGPPTSNTFAPFLFVAAIIIGQHISLTLVGIVAGLWNAEHTLMQRYGVVRIYGRKSGETDRTDEKAMLFSWLVFALVWGGADSRTPHLLTRVDLGATNEAGVTFLQSLQPFARIALAPAFGWVAYSAWKWRRTEHALEPTVGGRSRLQKRLYLGLTLMLFAVMIWNPIVGLVGYVGAHAVEYIVIVHSALRKRYAGPTGEPGGLVGRAVRTPLQATGCVIVYLVVVATFLRMVQTHATPTIANVVLLTIGGMHVFFDGFIWKLRRPVVAKSLL